MDYVSEHEVTVTTDAIHTDVVRSHREVDCPVIFRIYRLHYSPKVCITVDKLTFIKVFNLNWLGMGLAVRQLLLLLLRQVHLGSTSYKQQQCY